MACTFREFRKINLLKIIYKQIAENYPCGVARLSTAGRMAREGRVGVGIIAVTIVGKSQPWLG